MIWLIGALHPKYPETPEALLSMLPPGVGFGSASCPEETKVVEMSPEGRFRALRASTLGHFRFQGAWGS